MRDLLVDAANALRDTHLTSGPRAEWGRIDLLLEAWRTQINADSDPVLICDESVFRDFHEEVDRRRWQQMVAAGRLLAVPEADGVLLEQAHATGAAVLSRDRFKGWQRKQAWIVNSDLQFWDWYTDAGRVVIRNNPLQALPDYDLTRAEEIDERKAKGLGPNTPDADAYLSRLYRCVNPTCRYGLGGPVTRMPRRSDAGARCPQCGKALVDIGPRPPGRSLKLKGPDGSLLSTKNLADEQVITVGRGAGLNIWNVDEFISCPNVSRQHAEVRVRGGQVVVIDLHSANGTWVEPWITSDRTWGPGHAVKNPVTLLARDRIRLPGDVFIHQSALQYVVPEYL